MHEESDKPLNILTSLIALKPRQILLAEQQRRQPSVNERGTKMVSQLPQQDSNCSTGNPELKSALQKSIINYLHKNGLSKTLKRFLNEAKIESDDWKASSVDLDDIYERYAMHCQDSDVNIKGSVQEDVTVNDVSCLCVVEETSSKKKKKKENKIEDNNVTVVAANSEPIAHSISVDTDNIVKDKDTGRKIKSKEKKSKKKSDLVTQNNDNTKESGSIDEQKDISQKECMLPFQSVDSNVKDTEILTVVSEKKLASSIVTNGHDKISEGAGKAKDKKEKKKRQTVALVDDGQVKKINTVDNNDGTDVSQEDSKAKLKKKKKAVSEDNEKSLENATKKRKLTACNDGEEEPVEDLVNGKSKRRKISEVSEDENVKNSQKESQKSSAEEAVERIKGDQLKNGVQGSAEQKSLRKERNTEPRTANAFQRVKAEEVQFSDARLNDNSYWAKSGAKYGYGAKAQEVLGLVKGRDFRHEKTKKKRGSYRGGQIDFGAHSVKFNYSEEE